MKHKKSFQSRRLERQHLRNNKALIFLKRIPLLGIIAVFYFAPIFLLNSEGAEEKPFGDAFITASIADARTLIPILATDSSSVEIVSLVFNGLVKYDENLKLIGDLAESWEVKDGGLTIIFHLRKNVSWHDGKPFTAGDVFFSYRKLIDPQIPTPYSGDFERVESVVVMDEYTLEVKYKEPFSPGLASWSMPIMPEHIFKNENFSATKYARDPIGTGPYMFKRWRAGQRIDLYSNKKYFEHRPYISRYIYRVIPDTTTMFLELQADNIDGMVLTPIQYTKLTDTDYFKKNFNKFRYPSFGYTFMGYNLESDLFKDKRVRQAFNYAIDKNELIDGILMGLGRVSTGPFPKESWAYNKEVIPYPYDPNKAKDLLKEAGWEDKNKDGIIEKDGKPFEFTIITNQGNEERIMTAQIVERRLSNVGIKVNIRVLEWAVFINEFVNKKKFEAVIIGWNLSRDPDCYDIWHSSKTKPGEFNFIGYKNSEVDALLELGRKTFGENERKKVYNKIHKIIYDDQPCLFLYEPDRLIAIHKRFNGVRQTALGVMYNFIDWYVPEGKRKYNTISR